MGSLPPHESEELQEQVQSSLQSFFDRALKVDSRLLQALSLTDDPVQEHVASSSALLTTSIHALPALSDVLAQHDIPLERIRTPPLYPLKGLMPGSMENQLEAWFTNLDGGGAATAALAEVVQQGTIGLLEVLRGCLQARYLDDRRGERLMGNVSLNDLVHELSRAAQIIPDHPHRIDEIAVERLCLRVERSISQLNTVDPSAESQQFLMYHDGMGIRLQPFGVHGTYQLEDQRLRDGSLWVARGNVVQESRYFSVDSIGMLEEMINGRAAEKDFQQFFERHREFAFALSDYRAMHPQLILAEDDGGRLVPDFFLERIDSDLVDICDLKLPTAELVRAQRHRRRFRDAVGEAVAQVTEYRDWFEDRANRENFTSRYGLQTYRPRVVVVIGRKHSFYDDVDRLRLESGLPRWVTLRTYDDVVSRARQYRRFFSSL